MNNFKVIEYDTSYFKKVDIVEDDEYITFTFTLNNDDDFLENLDFPMINEYWITEYKSTYYNCLEELKLDKPIYKVKYDKKNKNLNFKDLNRVFVDNELFDYEKESLYKVYLVDLLKEYIEKIKEYIKLCL